MKKYSWQILLGLTFLLISICCYYLHYLIFKDAHHIFIYLLGDIGFVFIEVLMVSLIIHKILEKRERQSRLKKINMVIGVFFSEVGRVLLEKFANFDHQIDELQNKILKDGSSNAKKMKASFNFIRKYDFKTDKISPDWADLKSFLSSKRIFFLSLLKNPNILEHESFTEMLLAVFHLTEELEARKHFVDLPESDINHLKNDLKRGYCSLALEWIKYMEYLKNNYPYLFSLALRQNPFDRDSSPLINE